MDCDTKSRRTALWDNRHGARAWLCILFLTVVCPQAIAATSSMAEQPVQNGGAPSTPVKSHIFPPDTLYAYRANADCNKEGLTEKQSASCEDRKTREEKISFNSIPWHDNDKLWASYVVMAAKCKDAGNMLCAIAYETLASRARLAAKDLQVAKGLLRSAEEQFRSLEKRPIKARLNLEVTRGAIAYADGKQDAGNAHYETAMKIATIDAASISSIASMHALSEQNYGSQEKSIRLSLQAAQTYPERLSTLEKMTLFITHALRLKKCIEETATPYCHQPATLKEGWESTIRAREIMDRLWKETGWFEIRRLIWLWSGRRSTSQLRKFYLEQRMSQNATAPAPPS